MPFHNVTITDHYIFSWYIQSPCIPVASCLDNHRIITLMHADRILVLDNGQINGLGTHEELLKNCPTYLDIAKSQLSAKERGDSSSSFAIISLHFIGFSPYTA